MNIAIRVDASSRIGIGHLVRCRTLAETLLRRGAKVRFICRAHQGNLIDSLQADGFDAFKLPAPPEAGKGDLYSTAENYSQWLGVPQEQDAAETLAVLYAPKGVDKKIDFKAKKNIAARVSSHDWLIVDHYGLDERWEQALRPYVGRMMAIDDLANRRHDCDLLLDQNYNISAEMRYRSLLPAKTRTLLGPDYALLRPEYVHYRSKLHSRDGIVRRLMVFFGGTDPENMTGKALDVLCDANLTHLDVDLVVGANNSYRNSLASHTAMRPGARLHSTRPHLADLMAEADLGIGAGGATTWERCCLGLPSLVISIAENQRLACKALAADGLICYLGHYDLVSPSVLRDAILELSQDPKRLRKMADAGIRTVDGQGADRVAMAIMENT